MGKRICTNASAGSTVGCSSSGGGGGGGGGGTMAMGIGCGGLNGGRRWDGAMGSFPIFFASGKKIGGGT